jgi:hypothetical protein
VEWAAEAVVEEEVVASQEVSQVEEWEEVASKGSRSTSDIELKI